MQYSQSPFFRVACLALLVGLPLAVGCQKQEEISSYSAEGSAPRAVEKAADTVMPITWTVPQGWKPVSVPKGQMRYAAFSISADHPDVVLTVVPLPREQSPLLPNVVRWEKQLGLSESTEADLPKVVSHVELSPHIEADKVDLQGKDPKTAAPQQMLAAMVPHETLTWFFKLDGPPDVVTPERERFDAFLKSIRFHEDEQAAPVETQGPPVPPSSEGSANAGFPMKVDPNKSSDATHVAWDALPGGWQTVESSAPFRVHTIKLDANGQSAEIAVTRMNHVAAGDVLANINRWRGAVGLPPTNDASPYVPTKIVVCGQDGWLFQVEGPEKRIFVATTAAGQNFWFFKLTGPKDLVAAQREAFESFLKTAKLAGDAH